MADIASLSQNPFPLPQDPLTTLPCQRILDHEFVPVIQNHIRGIAEVEASFVKVDDDGNLLFGYEVQSGFVINEGIVTSAQASTKSIIQNSVLMNQSSGLFPGLHLQANPE